MFPLFAPIKNISFDIQKIRQEINALIKDRAVERTLPFKDGKSIYDTEGLLKIADDHILNDTSRYYIDEDGNRKYVPGKFKTYHVFNLTYLEEEPDSLIDIYRHDDPKKIIFWHKYKKPFRWREELESTYIKQFIESLPFEYVQGVRLIYMSPPSIGQIHRDSHTFANKKYFSEGFASISLNIDSGGGVLNFIDNQGAQYQIDDEHKIFHFDDSAAHGVTAIDSDRYQIRIWGKLNRSYTELLDMEKAVFK